MSLKVFGVGDGAVSKLLEECGHLGSLSIAMFKEQAAVRLQIFPGVSHDDTKVIKTFFPGG